MAEGNDISAIGPLNATAQKEGNGLVGWIIVDMVVSVALIWVVGLLANAIL